MSKLDSYCNVLLERYNIKPIKKSSEDIIKHAIKNKYHINFYYLGDNNIKKGNRLVKPAAFGYSKNNKPLLRAFQVQGPSRSKREPKWRLFRVDRIGKIAPTILKYRSLGNLYNKKGDKGIYDLVINSKF